MISVAGMVPWIFGQWDVSSLSLLLDESHGATWIMNGRFLIFSCLSPDLSIQRAIMFHIGVATQHPPFPEPDQLSEIGINFIKQCLTIDPVRRPTATELMNHAWMVDFRETLMRYEEGELTSESTTLTNCNYDNAFVARQAAKLQQQEVAHI